MNYLSHSAEQTELLGQALGAALRGNEVLLLEGELGAGKTCLVRGLARGMGLTDAHVSSPTFVIVNEYRSALGKSRASRLCHMDAYRLGGDDLDTINWDDLSSGDGVLAIEWPGRLGDAIVQLEHDAPARVGRITLEHRNETDRAMTLALPTSWLARPEAATLAALLKSHSEQAAERCRICGAPIGAGEIFCSSRCRMADLNRWFSGAYTVSRDATDEDFDQPPR